MQDELEYEAEPPKNRMVVAAMAILGLMIATYTLLFRLGFLGRIVCGTGACETVQLSQEAVQFGVPVPMWGVTGYGAMLVISLIGLQPTFARARWVSALLLAGGTTAMLFSAYLSYLEEFVINAWCLWCIGSAVIALIMFIAVLPELRRLRAASDRVSA